MTGRLRDALCCAIGRGASAGQIDAMLASPAALTNRCDLPYTCRLSLLANPPTLMRYSILLLTILIMAGCVSDGPRFNQAVLTSAKGGLTRNRSIYIATPKNGWFENTEYPGSGRMAATSLRAAFARFSDQVVVSESCTDLACLKRLRGVVQNSYFVVPELLHWESRGKNWALRPDVLEVKVSVFDYDNTSSRSSAILSARSNNTPLTSEHPQTKAMAAVGRR